MLEVNDSHTWKMKTLSILCSPKLSDHKEFLHTRSKQETNPQFWSWPCSGAYTLDKCYWTQTLPNDLLDSVSGVQHLRFEWFTNRKHTSSSCQTNQIHSLTQVTWISCHFTTYPHLFVSMADVTYLQTNRWLLNTVSASMQHIWSHIMYNHTYIYIYVNMCIYIYTVHVYIYIYTL